MAYVPINCSIHDQYLAWATLRQVVTVNYNDETGEEHIVTGRIVDVFTKEDRTEWMMLEGGEQIRLDRIQRSSVR